MGGGTEYRVYRVGEDEPVRRVDAAGRHEQAVPGAAVRRVERRKGSRGSRVRRWLLVLVVLAVVATAGVLVWLYGREMPANFAAAYDLAQSSGRVPEWALVGLPAAALTILAVVSAYLAFGRSLFIKSFGLLVVITTLVAPGLALGWVNGTVSTVGDRSTEVKATVEKVRRELRPALPSKPVNILLIGTDKREEIGDHGRSDTQILLRLDPETKSISMLSVPRDLRIEIPGVGFDKMNVAYTYGGAAGAVRAFSTLTGLPINHYVETDFGGFARVVNILGGVYVPVDRRYYNPPESSWKSINQLPGYQLLDGQHALDLARFRHDQQGDFNRMRRQQLILTEMQRQSGRWSGDWRKVVRLIKAITAQTTSDIDSLGRIKPLAELVFQVNTSKVNTVHMEGATPMIDGISYVVPSQADIDRAVAEFTQPRRAPEAVNPKTKGPAVTKSMYPVRVYNGSGIDGLATSAATQLSELGYVAEVGPDVPEFPETVTTIYAPEDLSVQAEVLATLFSPSVVKVVTRTPGVVDGISVFIASSFTGSLAVTPPEEPAQTLQKAADYAVSEWKTLAGKTPLPLMRPTVWCSGSTYEEFYRYRINTTAGRRVNAAVAVAKTAKGGYWGIQAIRWLNPPAIANPSGSKTVNGRRYLLFYQGSRLHMVAWRKKGTLYWVVNTLDNELSNDVIMGIATSFKRVK